MSNWDDSYLILSLIYESNSASSISSSYKDAVVIFKPAAVPSYF